MPAGADLFVALSVKKNETIFQLVSLLRYPEFTSTSEILRQYGTIFVYMSLFYLNEPHSNNVPALGRRTPCPRMSMKSM
jgi:hypothetical protein